MEKRNICRLLKLAFLEPSTYGVYMFWFSKFLALTPASKRHKPGCQ